MSLNVFLKVVEIQTKLASLFPFIIGVLFSMTYFGEVQWGNTLVFFIGMVVFDMATTAINNYMDFKKAKSDVYKYEENIIGQSGVSPQLVRNMIFAMIAFTAVVGAYLTGSNRLALPRIRRDLLLHRYFLHVWTDSVIPHALGGNFQWLHDGLRHLRLNRLLERRHQSAVLLNGRFC